ncbi:thermonuclease family protein [Thiolapillus sp.]|uniref:thermonuclease family protein n=2 Tax=Thiolapillus sp. TaxID=2017437 RepID=UPI0035AB6BE4
MGNRLVRVEWGKTDRYGRLIGTVYHDNQNINRMLMAIAGCTRATTAMSGCPTCSGKLKRPEKGYGASPNTTAASHGERSEGW